MDDVLEAGAHTDLSSRLPGAAPTRRLHPPTLPSIATEPPDVRPFAELTRGPVATVYKALDQTSGQIVVLKKVHTHDPEQRERFTAEARLAAGVKHPNVVQVLAVTDDSLVAEWVEGADLEDVVMDVGALPPELAALVAYETALGLEAVHQAGILHRDVSAANVLLSLEGAVKLTDFGLASLAGDDGDEVRGTLGTLAPEVVRGEAPGTAADLFSLGAVLVHALTGRAPFAAGDASGTLDAVLHLHPAATLVGDPRIPAELADLAEALLDKDPSSRPESAAEAADRLAGVLEALGSPGPGHLAAFLNAPEAYRSPPLPEARARRTPLPPAPLRPPAEPDPQPAPAPPRRSWFVPALLAAALALGAGVFALTGDDGLEDDPAAVLEEPPALDPVEVEPLEDDSLLAVADPISEPDVAAERPNVAEPSDREPVLTPTPPQPQPRPSEPAAEPDNPPRPEPPPPSPAEPEMGRLTLEVAPWANVRIGNRDLGRSPIRGLELPAGEYRGTLTNPGFPTVPFTVNIEGGRRAGMTVSLWDAVGTVDLRVAPWANVSVDGEPIGEVTRLDRPLILAPGRHTFRFENPALDRTIEREITVAEKEEYVIRVNMLTD